MRTRRSARCTRVIHQRVEELSLGRRYASIYFAGPTFNLLADDQTAEQALRAICDHLLVDGAALIPLWVPDPTTDDELGVTRATDGSSGITLTYTPLHETYNSERRTRTTAARYTRVSAGRTEVAEREWIIHWHAPDAFRRLSESAGLTVTSMVDDFTGGPATDASTTFTAVVRRAAGLLVEGTRVTRGNR